MNSEGVPQVIPISMPQSLSQNYLHIIYSTLKRHPHLGNRLLRKELHAYLIGICDNFESPVISINGVEDHVHILCRLSRKVPIMELIKHLKSSSTRWIKAHTNGPRWFYWQKGYGSFSISPSHVKPLVDYIENQEGHHRKESFQDEFRRFLKKDDLDWDERYVWD